MEKRNIDLITRLISDRITIWAEFFAIIKLVLSMESHLKIRLQDFYVDNFKIIYRDKYFIF